MHDGFFTASLGCNMAGIRRKLDEARFFLKQLEESREKHPDFDYFLSAFAAAARSISWVMKAEYCRVDGWKEWYESQAPQTDEVELLASFTKLRNRSQKEAPLETKFVIVMDFPPESLTLELKAALERGVGKNFEVTLYAVPEDGDLSNIPSSAVLGISRGVERRLDELGERDVLDACHKYFATLERLVHDCEAGFAA